MKTKSRLTLHITKSNFLDYYFGGSDQEKEATLISLGDSVQDYLQEEGKYSIDIQQLFDETSFDSAPLGIFEEHNDFGDIEVSEIEEYGEVEVIVKLIENKEDRGLYKLLGDVFKPKAIDEDGKV